MNQMRKIQLMKQKQYSNIFTQENHIIICWTHDFRCILHDTKLLINQVILIQSWEIKVLFQDSCWQIIAMTTLIIGLGVPSKSICSSSSRLGFITSEHWIDTKREEICSGSGNGISDAECHFISRAVVFGRDDDDGESELWIL